MKITDNQQSFQSIKEYSTQVREMVEGRMRSAVLDLVSQLFEDELESLCGFKYSRQPSEYSRSGSDPGSVFVQGQRVKVKKPRVKRDGKDIQLETYSALKGYDLLCSRVKEHMLRGVSTRDYEPLLEEISGSTGLKKSSVSKAFVKASRGALENFNSRDLSVHNFTALMADGVNFGDRCVVVVLGIDVKGKKHILGLREGSSENWELCKDLFETLISRGLRINKNYLFIIDGSKALRKAVKKVFGEKSLVQRCVRHKERNIEKYLPKERLQEFHRRWKRLHGSATISIALKEYADLTYWLGQINHAALESLEEANKETLTVIRFNVPPLLKKTLLSTNPIESTFSYTQYRVQRVKNWRSGPDQVGRWAATVLLSAEEKFRTVKGFMHLPKLQEEIERLKNLTIENETEVA